MVNRYLSKSDFKVARTCPTKLYYRKKGYPTLKAGDEYLSMLADQGYLIEALARVLYPDGRWIGFNNDVEAAAWDTMSALANNCTLFEATLINDGLLARVDILIKRGNVFEIIEIKSRAFDRQKNDERVQQGSPTCFVPQDRPTVSRANGGPILRMSRFKQTSCSRYSPTRPSSLIS